MSTLATAKMEDILKQLSKDIITPKFAAIKQTANLALELLQNEEKLNQMEAWEIREVCLQPLRLALESKARKLGHTALAGIQVMFKDERFRSSMETSDEDKLMPSQVLTVLSVSTILAEDLQIEVMKLLLNMTVTATWCTSAKTIIKISQVLGAIHLMKKSTKVRRTASACLLVVLAVFSSEDRSLVVEDPLFLQRLSVVLNKSKKKRRVYMGSYQNCVMVQGAVQAAFLTMINKFVGNLVDLEAQDQQAGEDDGDDVLADFKANTRGVSRENLISEVVLILGFLTERLEAAQLFPQGKQTLPLLLEGVNTILGKVPAAIKDNREFQELLWQRLCPCLILLLGEPKADKNSVKPFKSASSTEGTKSTGSSTAGPNINQASARVIYSIAGELASLVGGIPQLRPVLESLFHKILMFPLPPSRHDALRVVKELLSSPSRVVSLIGTGTPRAAYGAVETNLALIKMLLESIQQSSHQQNDPSVVYTCVACIDGLLASLDKLRQGEAIPDFMLRPSKGEKIRRSVTSNPDDDGGSDLSHDHYNDTEGVGESAKQEDKPGAGTSDETSNDSGNATNDGSSETIKSPKASPSRAQFEAEERENARRFLVTLQNAMPQLTDCYSTWDVDELLQELAASFCSSLSQNQFGGPHTGVVLNSDGVYFACIAALKFNLKLIKSGYYKHKSPPTFNESNFLNEVFSSGLLLYLPPAWLRELHRHVLRSSLLPLNSFSPGSASHPQSLVHFLQDLEGAGTTEERGRLMSECRTDDDINAEEDQSHDRARRVEAGKSLSASVLAACWPEVLDILSVMLREPASSDGGGGGGILGRPSLALLLATDSAQEDVRRARTAICTSLNGLQLAAKLCCVLGLQQLCGSAFSQLARTSCVKEDFKTALASAPETVGSRSQSKGGNNVTNKPKLVRLHAAHVLSMDVVMTTGLEMGSHSADCWKHVFRCCAHISELEHTYFSQGNNQSSLPKVTAEAQRNQTSAGDEADADGICDSDLYAAPVMAAVPVAPRINVPALIQQSSLESGWDNSLAAGGVLTFAQASKALCGLSQEVDSLFEDAADKLCLDALLGFLRELGESAMTQLAKLRGEATVPTNALHLYRLQQVLVRVVNSSRPLLHLLRVWSTVSPYLVQATGNSDHVISKMAVTSIHEFIVSLVSQRQERAHFHVNEYVCKTFEDMLCLELCDGDVQDQIVCCICELVEACSSQLQSGWRPLFGALRSVKIEYTTNEEVNEARQRHVAAVMDVFNVYLDMDNITVFANATVDCVLCLLKYVHGPATFDSDLAEDEADSVSDEDYEDDAKELESLCVPALQYLKRVCNILSSMWHMPASPVFKGAQRIQIDATTKLVDPVIPSMDFNLFVEEFGLDKYKQGGNISDSTDASQNAEERPSDFSSTGMPKCDKSSSIPVESSVGDDDKDNEQSMKNCNAAEKNDEEGDESMKKPDSGGGDGKDKQENEENSLTCEDKIVVTNGCSDVTDDGQNVSEEKKEDENLKEQQPSEKKPDLAKAKKAAHSLQKLTLKFEPKVMSSKSITQLASYHNLRDMDNKSGVLHVWFLLLDGLVSSINRCPKTAQSHALNTLIDLLKSAANIPGPEFSLYSTNHLLLPMLQAWLRRGARCYGYWNTGIVSFKQCCGLLADLVVDFIKRFTDQPDLDYSLQLLLQQTMDVFTECVAQPVENISRLGCSCIRHILLSCGPALSEHLWLVSVAAVSRALDVSTYSLRLLMALFHPNSDNFYGDIGQVKVATRKDCKVIDCLRLRQMAQQVFLLDSQVSSMPCVHYDTEQDKSYVFLLYSPDHQDSLNPDHISTRVPFRHIVVGLLSNQLLLQMLGTILLEPSSETKSEGNSDLPGLMPFMSTRVLHGFLNALEAQYRVAQDFDGRPGLKFLLQKVASLETAANLYKMAATALLFHVHSLVQVCVHLDNASISATRAAISPASETWHPSVSDLKHEACLSRAPPNTEGRLFLPLLQLVCEELCQDYMRVLGEAGKGGTAALVDKLSQQPIFFLTARHDDITSLNARTAEQHQKQQQEQQMMRRCRSMEQQNKVADSVSKEGSRVRSQSLDQEKQPTALEHQRQKSSSTKSVAAIDLTTIGGEIMNSLAIASPQAQEEEEDADSESEEGRSICTLYEGEDDDSDRDLTTRSKREAREDINSKVYTVATDQVIENLMQQYKRHKHLRSMPNFVRPMRHPMRRPKVPRREPVEEDIERQQSSSIMKDSEARVQAWSDSLTAILQITMALPDDRFSTLLPVTFTLVSQLIVYASDAALRDQLSQCFTRLGRLYDFAPPPSPASISNSSEKVFSE